MGARPRAPAECRADSARVGTQPPSRSLADGAVGDEHDLARAQAEFARCTADLIVATTGVDLSGLGVFDERGGVMMLAASNHRSSDWEHLVVDPGDGVANRVLRLGGSVTLQDYARESRSSQHLIDVFAHKEGAFGMLAVPVLHGSRVIAILYAGVRQRQYIGDRGETGLRNLSKLFAATLRLGRNDPKQTAPDTAPRTAVPASTLSPRETSMLRLLSRGLSTREIAETEYLAVNTVRSYIQSALWKLGANNRLQAVALARELHLV